MIYFNFYMNCARFHVNVCYFLMFAMVISLIFLINYIEIIMYLNFLIFCMRMNIFIDLLCNRTSVFSFILYFARYSHIFGIVWHELRHFYINLYASLCIFMYFQICNFLMLWVSLCLIFRKKV